MLDVGRDLSDGADPATPLIHGTPPRPVVLFAEGDDCSRLEVMIERLNHPVAIGQAGESRTAIAAVVCDRVEAPLDLCRSLAGRCPTILISDESDFAFRLAAVRAGVVAIIRRPVNPTEISEWLLYLDALETPADVSVLIVDDDWLAAEINASVLRSDGMTVATVTDPAKAVEAIETLGPDIVLMDLQMPGIGGVELARVIRQSMHFVSLPIVFLSAERDEDRQLAARRQGGDDFIKKPVQPDMLVSLVRLRADRAKLLRSFIERDRLTGLFDQTRFKERLAHEVERCRRTGAEICLAMIDLDHFKRVNDVHGHATGDDVLRALADLLGTGLRKIDIVGRCGGEEFGVILLDTSLEDAARILDGLRQRFSGIAFPGRQAPFNVTFSAGLASARDCRDTADLVAAADAALYGAKENGRNRLEWADRRDGADRRPPGAWFETGGSMVAPSRSRQSIGNGPAHIVAPICQGTNSASP